MNGGETLQKTILSFLPTMGSNCCWEVSISELDAELGWGGGEALVSLRVPRLSPSSPPAMSQDVLSSPRVDLS